MSAIRSLLFVVFISHLSLASAEIEIPPVPAKNGEGWFIHDYAGILDDKAMERIGVAQQRAFEQAGVPIIVVTINRMQDYGYEGSDIAQFTQAWFNHWQIGTKNVNGANSGILLLLSHKDRKVRIQLGDDWGHKWDAYSQRIIDRHMSPFLRQGDFARGLSNGAESLMEMALKTPASDPKDAQKTGNTPLDAATGVATSETSTGDEKSDKTFVYALFGIPMALGVFVIVGAIFVKEKDSRGTMLKYGFYLIALPLVVFVILMFAMLSGAAASRSRSNGSRVFRSSDSSESGGFFGGGYQGGSSGSKNDRGGGASGSW